MEKFITFLHQSEWFKGISAAIFGGFIRVYAFRKKGKFNTKPIIKGMLLASFVGMLVVEIINFYEMDKGLMILLPALSGFCHTEMLNFLTAKFLKRLKNDDNTKL